MTEERIFSRVKRGECHADSKRRRHYIDSKVGSKVGGKAGSEIGSEVGLQCRETYTDS